MISKKYNNEAITFINITELMYCEDTENAKFKFMEINIFLVYNLKKQ